MKNKILPKKQGCFLKKILDKILNFHEEKHELYHRIFQNNLDIIVLIWISLY